MASITLSLLYLRAISEVFPTSTIRRSVITMAPSGMYLRSLSMVTIRPFLIMMSSMSV